MREKFSWWLIMDYKAVEIVGVEIVGRSFKCEICYCVTMPVL